MLIPPLVQVGTSTADSAGGADREREKVVKRMPPSFDEIHVFDGVGERTGVRVERKDVRGSRAVCRSIGELCAKSRRLGDGFYYIASTAWPPDTASVSVTRAWVPIA